MQQFWGIHTIFFWMASSEILQVQYTKIWWMLSKMLTTCRSSKCTSIASHGQGGQGAANPHGWWTGCPGAEDHGARIQNMKKIWGCEAEFPEIGRFEIGPTSGTTFWSESWHSGPFFIPLWKWAAYPQLSSAFRTSQRAWTPRGWLPIWFHLKQTLAPRGTDYHFLSLVHGEAPIQVCWDVAREFPSLARRCVWRLGLKRWSCCFRLASNGCTDVPSLFPGSFPWSLM